MSDDLEDRKEEVWSMDEVRSATVETDAGVDASRPADGPDNSDTADTEDVGDTTDISDMVDTTGASDTEDTVKTTDTEVTGDTAGTGDTEDTGATAAARDTADTSDTTVTTDTEDATDPSDTEEQASVENVEGASTDADASPTTSRGAVGRATGETVRRMALDAEEKDLAVRDLHNVNVYLYEDIYREMMATFKELDSEYFREHGDDLSKNKDFFNAVFRAGLDSPRLREELELD